MYWTYPTEETDDEYQEENDEEEEYEELNAENVEEIVNSPTAEPSSANDLIESCLKKVLLQAVLEEEFQILSKSPNSETIQEKTILLSFMHKRLLMEFPPFKDRLDIHYKIEQLLV